MPLSHSDCGGIQRNRFTPLVHAAMNGHLSVVEYLVERGADVDLAGEVRYDLT